MYNIKEKIEEIRQKSEKERLYWVWGLTFFFTIIIIVFWVLAIKNQARTLKKTMQQKKIINEFQKQKESFHDVTQGVEKVLQKNPLKEGSELK